MIIARSQTRSVVGGAERPAMKCVWGREKTKTGRPGSEGDVREGRGGSGGDVREGRP